MRWIGGLKVGDGWALYHGAAGDNNPHAHYAAQLVCAETNGTAAAMIEDTHTIGQIIYIPSNVHHQLESSTAKLNILYAEPFLLTAPRSGKSETSEREHAMALFEALCNDHADNISANASATTVEIADARIKSAIDIIESQLDGAIRLAEIAKANRLSGSRFAELFRAETRLPLRQFVLWRRLRRAVLAISAGANATGAAHAAGFSDAAHFSRTVRAMFGVSPTDILSGIAITSDSR